jgi:hypothetical protein
MRWTSKAHVAFRLGKIRLACQVSRRMSNPQHRRSLDNTCYLSLKCTHISHKHTLNRPTRFLHPNVAMAVDPLSPIAPARIRALLLPVGRIKRSRFLAFVELLQPQCMVRLGDVSPDPRPDRSTDSPRNHPTNAIADLGTAQICSLL